MNRSRVIGYTIFFLVVFWGAGVVIGGIQSDPQDYIHPTNYKKQCFTPHEDAVACRIYREDKQAWEDVNLRPTGRMKPVEVCRSHIPYVTCWNENTQPVKPVSVTDGVRAFSGKKLTRPDRAIE